jgi:diguanylate cyclase (GGDEF)-like protein
VPAGAVLPQAGLELCGILQATLDPQHLLELALHAVQARLPVSGLEFWPDQGETLLRAGNTAAQVARYELVVERRPLGSLQVFHGQPLDSGQAVLLEDLLSGLAYPLRNALNYIEAVELASHDPLTGVQNRRAMNQALVREVELAQRQKTHLSMLIIDADEFKRFNDRFGHSFGDKVLRKLADTTATTVRRSDLLYRFGGEEFVVLAAYTANDDACLLAERIRAHIAQIDTVAGQPIRLTVSIGVSTLLQTDSPESLFERADAALYRAKRNGRNRVQAG